MLAAETLALRQTAARSETQSAQVEEAVREHAGLVYRVAYSVLRNHHDSEDATQETFLRLLRYRTRLEKARNPRAFLARVAWRVALDRVRRRKRSAEISLDDDAGAVRTLRARGRTAEQIASSREMQALLERLIATLPGKLRDAFTLSTVEELTSPEIAAALGIPEASVRTRMHRARGLLQEKLSAVMGTTTGEMP